MKIKIMGSFYQSCPAHRNLEPGLPFAAPNPLASILPLRSIPRPRERERVAEGRVRASGETLNVAGEGRGLPRRSLAKAGEAESSGRESCSRFTPGTILRKLSKCFLLLFALLAAPLFAPSLCAQDESPQVESRYLFIFDTSSAMKKRLPGEEKAIYGLFAINLNGKLHPGDSLGVWTFNNELHTGEFPLEEWQPGNLAGTASNIVAFVEAQHYSKTTSFDQLMPMLNEVMRTSQRLTTLIFCDGEGQISGSPADAKFNSIFQANESAMKKARLPFIIVLRSQFGHYVGVSMNTPDSINIPDFPALPPPPAPVVTAPPPPPPPPPAVPPLIIIGTRVETNLPSASAPAVAPPQMPAPAPPVAPPPPANPVPPAVPPPVNPTSENRPLPETNMPAAATVSTSPPATNAVAATPEIPPPPVAPVKVAIAPPAASSQGGGFWLIIGAGFLAGAGLMMYFIFRSRHRHSPSLITESLKKNKS